MDVGSFYRSDATALKHIIVWNCLCVCDLNSNHSFWLLTQNSIHGKLPKRNEKSNRVHDRFDFTPGPGVGSVLATNRTGAPTFPSSAVLFIPTFAGCVTTQYLNQKCIRIWCAPCKFLWNWSFKEICFHEFVQLLMYQTFTTSQWYWWLLDSQK